MRQRLGTLAVRKEGGPGKGHASRTRFAPHAPKLAPTGVSQLDEFVAAIPPGELENILAFYACIPPDQRAKVAAAFMALGAAGVRAERGSKEAAELESQLAAVLLELPIEAQRRFIEAFPPRPQAAQGPEVER